MPVRFLLLILVCCLSRMEAIGQPVQLADVESRNLSRFSSHILNTFSAEACCDTDSLQIPVSELLKVMHWPDDPATVKQLESLLEGDNKILSAHLLEVQKASRKFLWKNAQLLHSELKPDQSNRQYCDIELRFQSGKRKLNLYFRKVMSTTSGFYLRSTSELQVRN